MATKEPTDEAIAAAAASISEKTGATNEPNNVKDMVETMNKHSDGTNVIKESIITFQNPFGSDKKGDRTVPASEPEKALEVLKEMVEEQKSKAKPKKKAKWEFRTCPHEIFGKTLDETLMAFLLWARMNPADFNEKEKKKNSNGDEAEINVSKAFRRLEHYAEWMEDTGTDLVEPPLTAESVKRGLEIWAMKVSVDKESRLVWWFDFEAMDLKGLKEELSPEDSLRAFVWYAHYIMYDPNAQEKGLVYMQNCDQVGFMQMMTLFPMKVGTKIDRLTIGVLPVKMHALYMLESPTWMTLFMKFMSLFMSKKMKERVIFLKDYNEIEGIVGKECIPKKFGQLEGSLEVDPVQEKYFSN